MYNIIIFGTGKTSKVVESSLNNNVNILAYCDNDKSKWNKELNGKMIISPEEIKKIDYDYVVIASQFNEEMYEQLLKLEVEDKKIFQFFKFNDLKYNIIKINLRSLLKYNLDAKMLITGISYAVKGIDISKFSNKSHNLACGSQDLYFDYHLMKYVLEKYKDKLKELKYVMIGLSYYSFEYDMSLSAMKSRVVFYYETIGLKHNFNGIDKILSYKNVSFDIANKLLKFNENNDLIIDWVINNKSIYKIDDQIGKKQALLDGNKNYPKTVDENIKIFNNYLKLLKDNDIEPLVVVFPVSQYYSKYFPERIKEEFLNIIHQTKKENEFQFINYFDSKEFLDEDFYDVSHLNENGAAKFTSILDKLIKW